MSDSSNQSGCGCVPAILTILAIWTVLIGLPTPWGVFHIDIFPPAIRLEVSEVVSE